MFKRRYILKSLISFLILIFAFNVFANSTCENAFIEESEKSNVPPVFLEIVSKAEQGDPKALYQLANMYLGGFIAGKGSKDAFSLFELSAEQDYTPAKNSLAGMYLKGEGVMRDPEKALSLYEELAENGNAIDKRKLGMMYANGLWGIGKNPKKAESWYRKAIEQGDETARSLLDNLHKPLETRLPSR